MQELRLGEVIRRRREELNISQEALCEGLCSVAALSRFETGRQGLSFKRVTTLLERLGLPHEQYSVLLNEEELALETAEREARCASVLVDRVGAEERPLVLAQFREKLAALEALGPDNPFICQCSLSLRAATGDENGPYSPDRRLSMLLEAIRLTVPKFDLERISLGPYSAEELRLINQLAVTYIRTKEYEKALHIYHMALEYLEANGQRLRQYSALRAYLCYNYGRALCGMGRWQEALDIAALGRQSCVESARYHVLASILCLQAECHFYLGNKQESMEMYYQAHYVLKATGDQYNLQLLDAEAEERLGLTFPF